MHFFHGANKRYLQVELFIWVNFVFFGGTFCYRVLLLMPNGQDKEILYSLFTRKKEMDDFIEIIEN